jgi:hypothetical protein
MSFESDLSSFPARLFGFTDPSQKRPFLRGDSGDADFLIFENWAKETQWDQPSHHLAKVA